MRSVLMLIISFGLRCVAAFTCPASELNQTWCNVSAPLSARISSLVSRLTFSEKVQQLQTTHSDPHDLPGYIPRLNLETYTTGECLHGVIADNVTVFPQSISLAATWNVTLMKQIAGVIGKEVRGRRNAFRQLPNSTLKPPGLVCFSPQINIVRDPRWGRNQETYGESPFLTGVLARTYVSGLQGDNERYVQAVATPKHFNAFGGRTSNGSYPTGSPTEATLSLRDWVETFLTAFEHVLATRPGQGPDSHTNPRTPRGDSNPNPNTPPGDSNPRTPRGDSNPNPSTPRGDSNPNRSTPRTALSTMCSYNTLCMVDEYTTPNGTAKACPAPSHGVPACASHGLLAHTLREVWGFDGYVIGDAGAVKFIQTDHHWANNQSEVAKVALRAGVDMVLGGGCNDNNIPRGCISYGALPQAVADGLLRQSDIDTPLRRVLAVRFKLGLMDDPSLLREAGLVNPYARIPPSVVNSPQHRLLARQAARESVVLLTNQHHTLPLNPNKLMGAGVKGGDGDGVGGGVGGREGVAVIGPNANVTLFGNYAGSNPHASTLLAGIRAALSPSTPLTYARGCDVSSNDTSGFALARATAQAASVTVACIGISQAQEHEGGKRRSIALPGMQSQLMRTLRNASTRLVVVVVGGSAVELGWVAQHADAVLWTGYGGEEAGTGLADILFGSHSPSGKLPFTLYAGDYQLPVFGRYNMRGEAFGGSGGRTFRFLTSAPAFYFGHGLSYARFTFEDFQVSPALTAPPCSALTLTFRVTNSFGPLASEVAQVYVSRYVPTSNPDAVRVSLAGFIKTRLLRSGEGQNITIVLNHRALSEVKLNVAKSSKVSSAGWRWTPGVARIWVGGRSPTVEEIEGQRLGSGQSSAWSQDMLYAEVRLSGKGVVKCEGEFDYSMVSN